MSLGEITSKTIKAAAEPGKWSAAGHLAVPALTTTLKAIPTKFERFLQDKYRRGVASPALTPDQLAGAQAISAAAEREARALSARGSATRGRSGMDLERARLARKAALNKLSQYLSSARRANLARYSTDVGAHSKLGETVGALDMRRKDRLWADIVGTGEDRPSGYLGDESLVKALRTLGRRERTKEGEELDTKLNLKEEKGR